MRRIGQENKVTYIDLVAKDTVDEKIVKALRNKLLANLVRNRSKPKVKSLLDISALP